MEFSNLIIDNTCDSYSQKIKDRMNNLSHVGEITTKTAEVLGGILVVATMGKQSTSEETTLYWVVSEETDAIMAAKFRSFGPIATIVSSDVLTGLLIGKTLHKAIRITDSDIESVLRDDPEIPALPELKMNSLTIVTDAVKEAAAQHKGSDILEELNKELKAKESAKPKTIDSKELLHIDEDLAFAEMTPEQKLQTVEVTLDDNIRQMLIMDGGDMEVIDIKQEETGISIYIRYLGNCSGCATGDTGTLYAIETVLKEKLDPTITVIPI